MNNQKYRDENGVLYNKLGITDAKVLRDVEYQYSLIKAEAIMSGDTVTRADYGLDKLKDIHKELFGGIYEWAGQARETPSGKWESLSKTATRFVDPEDIPAAWEKIESSIGDYLGAATPSLEQSRKALQDIFVAANHSHVFVEGNGRALQIFMSQLAQEKGLDIDFTKADRDMWNMACALSAPHDKIYDRIHRIPQEPNTAPLEKIFQDIVIPGVGYSHSPTTPTQNEPASSAQLQQLESEYKKNQHLLSPMQKQVAAAAQKVFDSLPVEVQNQAKINLYQNQLASISRSSPSQDMDDYGHDR